MSESYRTIVADPPWEIGDFPANFGYEAGKACPYPTMSLDKIKALPVGAMAAPEAHLYLWTTAGFLVESYEVARAWGFEPMYPLVWCKPRFGQGLGGKFTSNVEFVLFCRERHGAVRITQAIRDAAKAIGFSGRKVDECMGTRRMAQVWWFGGAARGQARIPTWEQWLRLKTFLPIGDEYDDDVRLVSEGRNDGLKCDTRWFNWPRGKHSQKPEAFLDLVEQVSPGPYLEMFARRARFGWDYWGDESLGTAELAS